MALLGDITYNLEITKNKASDLQSVLKLTNNTEGFINNFSNGSSLVLNGDRLILNAKKDHLLLCGKEGVTLTSPKNVRIDCDDDLQLFSNTEVYIGLPNKGNDYNFDDQKNPKSKSDATTNVPYEPLVLGLKLINLIEDVLILLKNTTIRTPAGDGYMSEEMMYNLSALQSRLPEILSTYAFVDGVSHKGVDPGPSVPLTKQRENSTAEDKGNPGVAIKGGYVFNQDGNLGDIYGIQEILPDATFVTPPTTPTTNEDGNIKEDPI